MFSRQFRHVAPLLNHLYAKQPCQASQIGTARLEVESCRALAKGSGSGNEHLHSSFSFISVSLDPSLSAFLPHQGCGGSCLAWIPGPERGPDVDQVVARVLTRGRSAAILDLRVRDTVSAGAGRRKGARRKGKPAPLPPYTRLCFFCACARGRRGAEFRILNVDAWRLRVLVGPPGTRFVLGAFVRWINTFARW